MSSAHLAPHHGSAGEIRPRETTDARSQSPYPRIILAQLTLLACTLLFQHTAALVPRPSGRFTEDVFYMRALLRFYVVLFGSLLLAFLLQPAAASWLDGLRSRLTAPTKRLLIAASVTLACLAASCFLIHFGRHQFGSWDYDILIDAGYRGLLGQRAFIDFVTPTPPFFNWTGALAFRLFGLTWDATLFLAAVFSSVTLVWSFFLLRAFGLGAFAALATASTVQAAAMLSCCFLWYNNTTLVLAALFFLACLVLARTPHSRLAQISFVILFGVLPLTKPNIAGLTFLGCLLLLFATSNRRKHVALLCAIGAGLCALLFDVMHVSLPGMLAAYRGVARERGGLSTFGFDALSLGERQLTVLWLLALCTPLTGLLPGLRADLRNRQWSPAAFWLFFPLAAFVAVCGVAGNGELRDVECTLLIVALATLAFSRHWQQPWLRKMTIALLCGMFASDLYAGMARLRVYTIRPHFFFEWTDNSHRFNAGFLRNVTGSEALFEVDAEMRQATHTNLGPFFFGPRLDFEYPNLDIAPPLGWTTFFQPGTAFARDQTEQLVESWKAHRFETLVFLKDDYVFYPDALKDFIRTHYFRDDASPRITVWRRRPFARNQLSRSPSGFSLPDSCSAKLGRRVRLSLDMYSHALS